MKYARIRQGLVCEIIPASEIPIEDRFQPAFVAELLPIPEGEVVREGMIWDGTAFVEPPPE